MTNPSENALKPCPFCGNQEIDQYTVSVDKQYHKTPFEKRMVCRFCDAVGPMEFGKEFNNVIWNTRHESQPALVRLDETEILEYIPKVGISTLSKAVHTARAICLRFGKSKESLVLLDGIKMANLIHKTELLDYSRSKNNPRKWNVTSKQALMIAQNICSTFGQVPQRDEVTVEDIVNILNLFQSEYLTTKTGTESIAQAIHDRIYGGKK